MRLALLAAFAGCVVLAGSALAQSTDPYAPPPPPAPGSPESAPGALQPFDMGPPSQQLDPQASAQAQAIQSVGEERFDIDCDPDIDVCVDPQAADTGYDDGYDPNAYQQFQSALAPYGQWTDDPNYGQVWIPSASVVGADFEPYASAGQWVATSDYGYAWASDYDWGWAPFHYGRWMVIGGYGWCWIPGSIWGPAWVDWRYGNGYVGWAPLPPRGVVGPPPRSGGAYGNNGHSRWHFTVANDFTRHNPRSIPTSVIATVYPRTQPIHNARVVNFAGGVSSRINLGPPVDRVSRDLGRPVQTVALSRGAPSALPRTSVTPRVGVTLTARPYVRNAVTPGYGGVSRANLGPAPSLPHSVARPVGSYPEPPRAYPTQQVPPTQPYAPHQPYGTPAYSPPAATRPIAPAQPYAHPYQSPAYQSPAYQSPAYQRPAYQQPAYPSHTYSPPSYQSPVHTPAYSAPSRSYSPPAPAYSAPARSAPPPAPVMTRPSSSPSFSSPATRRRY